MEEYAMKPEEQDVYSNENGEWGFYDENNRPTGILYPSIEKAIDALYQKKQIGELPNP